jgi:osmotically-inducible protein OsmY
LPPTLRSSLILGLSAFLVATIGLNGCHGGKHPDDRMAVYNALDKNDLRSVTVSQDQGNGTITLSGIVGSMERRQKAEQIAQQTAPGYRIVDRIQVQSTGLQDDIQSATQQAKVDRSIENDFKKSVAEEPSLKSERIQCTAYHGTVTLKGAVRTSKEREQAEDLAKKVPQVQHVINEIRIRPGKPSPANS